MIGFQTKNSTYYVDQYNKVITGGYFGDKKVRFVQLQAIIGDNAYIKLLNGEVIKAGKVVNYI